MRNPNNQSAKAAKRQWAKRQFPKGQYTIQQFRAKDQRPTAKDQFSNSEQKTKDLQPKTL